MAHSRPFGNIRKLPSGRYQARYWHLGAQVPADITFATKAEARAWLATMETDILGGRHVNPTSGRELFGVYAARWLEARYLRPRTRDTYASQLIHILTEFENVELRQIAPTGVRAWHGRLAKSDLHANTVAKIYRLFRTMLDTAVDDGLLRVNPVHIKGAAVERSVERPELDWDDVQRIAAAIHPRFSALVWVGATSGLRFGELTGLTRRHVDLDERTLRVEQALMFIRDKGPTLGPPKSVAAHRTITIPVSAAQILAGHLHSYAEEGPDAFVFTSIKAAHSSTATSPHPGSEHSRRRAFPKPLVSTTSATSPEPRQQQPELRCGRSCRGWASRQPTHHSATSRRPSAEMARSPTQ